jgi:hypothetical protein
MMETMGQKKTAGVFGTGGFGRFFCLLALRARLSSAGNREPKVGKKVSAEGGHVRRL